MTDSYPGLLALWELVSQANVGVVSEEQAPQDDVVFASVSNPAGLGGGYVHVYHYQPQKPKLVKPKLVKPNPVKPAKPEVQRLVAACRSVQLEQISEGEALTRVLGVCSSQQAKAESTARAYQTIT